MDTTILTSTSTTNASTVGNDKLAFSMNVIWIVLTTLGTILVCFCGNIVGSYMGQTQEYYYRHYSQMYLTQKIRKDTDSKQTSDCSESSKRCKTNIMDEKFESSTSTSTNISLVDLKPNQLKSAEIPRKLVKQKETVLDRTGANIEPPWMPKPIGGQAKCSISTTNGIVLSEHLIYLTGILVNC